MARHYMIDIETFGTTPGSVIWQIGVCEFNPAGDYISAGIRISIDPQDCLNAGLKMDWAAVHYWMTQESAAREALPVPGTGFLLKTALVKLANFLAPGCHVWGNGSIFDIALLEHAYRLLGLKIPWHFRNIMDVRTVAMLCDERQLEVERTPSLIPHDGLSDAHAQAKWVQDMYKALNKAPVSVKYSLDEIESMKERADKLEREANALQTGVRDGAISASAAIKLGEAAILRKKIEGADYDYTAESH